MVDSWILELSHTVLLFGQCFILVSKVLGRIIDRDNKEITISVDE